MTTILDIADAVVSELNGAPDYYSVKFDQASDFFLSLTAPQGGETDFDAKLTVPGFSEELNGAKAQWQPTSKSIFAAIRLRRWQVY